MSSDGGAIQNFVRSLYSGRFYAAAPSFPVGVGFRNLALLAAILAVVTSTEWASEVSRGFAEWQMRVEDGTMPAMLLRDGRLSVRGGPQPFFRREANGGVLIIDTTGTYAGVPDSLPEGLFIGRDRAIQKSAVPQVSRTYEFRNLTQGFWNRLLGFWLDGPGLKRAKQIVLTGLVLFGTPMGFVYYFLGNTLVALVIAWLGLVLSRFFDPAPRLRYGQVLVVTLFVLTPVAILFRFLGLVLPEYSRMLLPFYPALAASLLMAALRASAVPREPSPDA